MGPLTLSLCFKFYIVFFSSYIGLIFSLLYPFEVFNSSLMTSPKDGERDCPRATFPFDIEASSTSEFRPLARWRLSWYGLWGVTPWRDDGPT